MMLGAGVSQQQAPRTPHARGHGSCEGWAVITAVRQVVHGRAGVTQPRPARTPSAGASRSVARTAERPSLLLQLSADANQQHLPG
jgi:hypothetical protein